MTGCPISDLAGVTITLAAPYRDLTFMTALSGDRADRLAGFVAGEMRGTVVDIGCGWAELLLRVVAAAPECRGVGVDLDADAIRHGQDLAAQRGFADRVTLTSGDAKAVAPDQAEAVICVGATQCRGRSSEQHSPLDYAGALEAIRAMVLRGSRVVYGEAVWSAPPTPEAVVPLGARLDELVSVADLVDVAVDSGFMPVGVHEATIDEWDEFESGYSACYATWLAEHDPDADEVRARARRQRDSYLYGYRGIMGMAYLQLLAT